MSIEKDIRPISLTPIAAEVFESIIMKWVDETIKVKLMLSNLGELTNVHNRRSCRTGSYVV